TQEKLKKLSNERERQLLQREKTGIQSLSILGYTNAGKTSLFNLLTGKNKYAKDELFATLDSITAQLYLKDIQKEVLISDTIGLIRNHPPQMIDAFKSTLMESIHADVLLHVIDSNDPHAAQK